MKYLINIILILVIVYLLIGLDWLISALYMGL